MGIFGGGRGQPGSGRAAVVNGPRAAVVLCARPGIGAVTLALLFGLFNLFYGTWTLVQGIELRRTGRTLHAVTPGQPGTKAA